MPHSTFSFRKLDANSNDDGKDRSFCYGVRWIANRLDTYYGPFLDLDDLKQWFERSTSHEYNGCMGKPGKRIEDARSVMQERRENATAGV
jgi:hypothetical protein